ncbi:MAG: CoA pyrophosphatase [Bacteroidota bacterium]
MNDIAELSKKLNDQLSRPLPGAEAHFEIAPYRNSNDYSDDDLSSAKKSGVLVLLYAKDDLISIPLIKRVEYPGVHSGQISFPGGKMEDEDKTIVSTALREAREEINVAEDTVTVVGELSQVFIPPSKSLVTPILAYTKEEQNFEPELKEVDRILSLNLDNIVSDSSLIKSDVRLTNGLSINVPGFRVENEIIWGATAMMLNELRYLLKGL